MKIKRVSIFKTLRTCAAHKEMLTNIIIIVVKIIISIISTTVITVIIIYQGTSLFQSLTLTGSFSQYC